MLLLINSIKSPADVPEPRRQSRRQEQPPRESHRKRPQERTRSQGKERTKTGERRQKGAREVFISNYSSARPCKELSEREPPRLVYCRPRGSREITQAVWSPQEQRWIWRRNSPRGEVQRGQRPRGENNSCRISLFFFRRVDFDLSRVLKRHEKKEIC